jgi:hypothetical protein
MEAVMLGIVWPAADLQRTILPGILDLYCMWAQLLDFARDHLPEGHIEQPFFHGWELRKDSHMFHCPFTNVDEEKFENFDQQRTRLTKDNLPE